MSIEDFEAAVLQLDPKACARLAAKLLHSLEELSDEDLIPVWTEEAQRQDADLDADPDAGALAGDVFREARLRLS